MGQTAQQAQQPSTPLAAGACPLLPQATSACCNAPSHCLLAACWLWPLTTAVCNWGITRTGVAQGPEAACPPHEQLQPSSLHPPCYQVPGGEGRSCHVQLDLHKPHPGPGPRVLPRRQRVAREAATAGDLPRQSTRKQPTVHCHTCHTSPAGCSCSCCQSPPRTRGSAEALPASPTHLPAAPAGAVPACSASE
jgi:hypothetical protein